MYNPAHFRETSLMVSPVQAAFQKFTSLPLVNLIRTFNPDPHTYSFWDFQGGAWPRNNGILLDFFFATKKLADNVTDAVIYKDVRGWDKSSDHAPIGCTIKKND